MSLINKILTKLGFRRFDYKLYYCPVCKKDTNHREFTAPSINNAYVCKECNKLSTSDGKIMRLLWSPRFRQTDK